jgi:hypothetical protein
MLCTLGTNQCEVFNLFWILRSIVTLAGPKIDSSKFYFVKNLKLAQLFSYVYIMTKSLI